MRPGRPAARPRPTGEMLKLLRVTDSEFTVTLLHKSESIPARAIIIVRRLCDAKTNSQKDIRRFIVVVEELI